MLYLVNNEEVTMCGHSSKSGHSAVLLMVSCNFLVLNIMNVLLRSVNRRDHELVTVVGS